MAYLELFKRVTDHLERLDEPFRFKRGSPLSKKEVARICERSAIPVPLSIIDLYSEVGNGFSIDFEARGERAPFANLEFAPLEEIAAPVIYGIEWKTEWSDSYDFRFTDNPRLAKKTSLKMRHWLQFHQEGNGDSICLDTASDPAPVVFNQHDWLDGGTGENGHILADSLPDFMVSWSTVCFQFPRNMWWPTVFRKTDGVDWASAEFCEPFRLQRTL
jgi:hypothetical protein